MKRLLVMLVLVVLPLSAMADAPYCPECSTEVFNTYINNYEVDYYDCEDCVKEVEVETRRDPAGVGLDVVVYEDDDSVFEAATVEYKRDFQNDENSVFLVGRVNVFKLFNSGE